MKAFLFCFTHSLPTAMLLTEEGVIVQVHGGSDADDAKYWFNHFNKGKGYEVVEMDQKLIDQHLYHGASIETLPADFVAAFRLNQKKGKK